MTTSRMKLDNSERVSLNSLEYFFGNSYAIDFLFFRSSLSSRLHVALSYTIFPIPMYIPVHQLTIDSVSGGEFL